MHVLIIPSWYPSRHIPISGIFFKEQAEALAKVIEKVGVVSPLFRTGRHLDFSRNKNYKGQVNGVITYTREIWHYPRLKKFNQNNWFKSCERLFEEYLKENGRPDLIHVHSIILSGSFAEYIKRKYNIPFVITEHSTGFHENYFEKDLRNFSQIVSKSSYNIAVSKNLADILENKIEGKWDVLPNIVNQSFLDAGKIKLKINKPRGKIFFSLGMLVPIKGFDILLKAFTKLVKLDNEVQLKIGGEGIERKKLEGIIRENKITKNVRLLGNLSRLETLKEFSSSDFFILPSLYETFGVVVIEALACGLPTIATRCGGPDFTITKEVGILVNKNSVEELYLAMEQMLGNTNNYIRQDIIQYCEENFSENAVNSKLLKIYNKVLND